MTGHAKLSASAVVYRRTRTRPHWRTIVTSSHLQKEKKERKERKEKKEKKERKEKTDKKRAREPEPEPEPVVQSKKKDKSKKKQKSKQGADLESHPIDVAAEEPYTQEDHGREGRQGTAAKAFQRVKADEWIDKKGSWDNSYVGTFGEGGWGFKAQQVLGQVRGKDFRHEKTKKKRGSYRGGLIDSNAVCSYKFESDDD